MNAIKPGLGMPSLVASTFIHTDDCKDAQESFDELKETGPLVGGLCLLLSGEAGVGKSTLLQIFGKGLAPVRTPEGWFRPLLEIVVPTAPTAISLFEALLTALGDPCPTKGTRSDKKGRVVKMLREQQVCLLFLDDLQHFLDRDQDRILFDASEALKELLFLYPICVVCAGLKDAKRVVNSNEQLKRRHMRTVQIRRFDWQQRQSRLAFIGVLKKFAARFEGVETLDVTHEQVALRFFLATGGIMDFVAKIFICSAAAVERTRSKVLTLEILARAWKRMLFHAEDAAVNPFLCDMEKVGDAEIKIAMAINAEVPAATKKRSAKRRLQAVGL